MSISLKKKHSIHADLNIHVFEFFTSFSHSTSIILKIYICININI